MEEKQEKRNLFSSFTSAQKVFRYYHNTVLESLNKTMKNLSEPIQQYHAKMGQEFVKVSALLLGQLPLDRWQKTKKQKNKQEVKFV
jgi:hypothetical protein